MPAPKHSTTKVLVEMSQYEYQLMKKWLVKAFNEYFYGNDPEYTGFTMREAHHIDYLVTRIAQNHRVWAKVLDPPPTSRKPRF